jgi:hypothetical protein
VSGGARAKTLTPARDEVELLIGRRRRCKHHGETGNREMQVLDIAEFERRQAGNQIFPQKRRVIMEATQPLK